MLGVIGLVIGGIWVAASAVNYKMRVNETATGIERAVTMAVQDFRGIPPASGSIDDWAIKTRAVPPNWVTGSTIRAPLGTSFSIGYNAANQNFGVGIDDITVSDCMQLLSALKRGRACSVDFGVVGSFYVGIGNMSDSTYGFCDMDSCTSIGAPYSFLLEFF